MGSRNKLIGLMFMAVGIILAVTYFMPVTALVIAESLIIVAAGVFLLKR